MGVGSWLGGRVGERHAVEAFVAVECVVALLGGLSALALFAAYAWLDLYDPAVRTASVVLGALVGAEIPLLVTIVGRFKQEEAGRTVGAFLAADYVGAFAVGLAFPVVVLPALGQVQAALAFGAVNAVGGAVVLVAHARRAASSRAPGAVAGGGRRACRPRARLARRREHRGVGAPGALRRPARLPGAVALPGHRAHPVARRARPAPVPQRRPAVLLARRASLPRGARAPGAWPARTARARARRRRRPGAARGPALPAASSRRRSSSSTRRSCASPAKTTDCAALNRDALDDPRARRS